jgi:hypothetical protein
MLQQCAKRLNTAAEAFQFAGLTGLTPAIKESLYRELGTAKIALTKHTHQHRKADERVQYCQRRKKQLYFSSAGLGALLLMVLVAASLAENFGLSGIVLILMGVGGWFVWQSFQTLEAKVSASSAELHGVQRELAQAEDTAAMLHERLRVFEASEASVRANATILCELADEFESVALRRLALSPPLVVPMDRKGPRDLIRVDRTKAAALGMSLDDSLLPIDLRSIAEPCSATSKYWIARPIGSGATEILSRCAAYFDVKQT